MKGLFEHKELTLGIMLDAVASAAAEIAAYAVERNHLERSREEDRVTNSTSHFWKVF